MLFEKLNELLRPVGLTIGALLIGILGAWASLGFFPTVSWQRKLLLLFSGALTAAYGGQIIAYYSQIPELVYALTFFTGLLGMLLINLVTDFLRFIIKNPKAFALFIRYIFTKGK
jgi:hypothetical protein